MKKRPGDLLSKQEFDLLAKDIKIDIVLDQGKYMHWKRQGQHNILLYRLNGFYVQLFLLRSTGKILKLEAFSSSEGLLEFLNEIQVA